MFANILKLIARNLYKDRLYSLINLVGLSLGFACFLVIFLYLKSELSYDRHFDDYQQIYRLTADLEIAGEETQHAKVGSLVGPLLAQDYEQFADFARLSPLEPGTSLQLIGETFSRQYNGPDIYGADNSTFDIFSHTIVAGDPQTALTEPRTLAISESVARLYFGDENPVGKTLGIQVAANPYTVDLVFADLPENTSHRYDILVYYNTLNLSVESENLFEQGIIRFRDYLFFRLPAGYDVATFPDISEAFFERYVGSGGQQMLSEQNARLNYHLQPISEIHLAPALTDDVPKGNSFILLLLGAVAIFILGVASVNYMNLSTARFASRAREVGVRRTLGAGKSALLAQFLGEGLVFSMLALLLACGLCQVLLSTAIDNDLLGKELAFSLTDSGLLLQLSLIGLVVGLLSGLYPALYFSSVRPIDVFKPLLNFSPKGMSLRSVLIGLQMLVALSVIASALIMYRQVTFMQDRPLGFDKENKLDIFVILAGAQGSSYRSLLAELSTHPGVLNATMTDIAPGMETFKANALFQNPQGEDVSILSNNYLVDEHYLATMNIPLLAGRNFADSSGSSDDVDSFGFLVNEALVKQMGWENPIGQPVKLPVNDISGEVIGVVADFHFSSLHEEVQPLLLERFYDNYRWQRHLIVDIDPAATAAVIAHVAEVMSTLAVNGSYRQSFLDTDLDALYGTEQKQMRLVLIGSVACMLIAIIGLFGLTTFTIEQRSKEIGIRKVLGASTTRILALLFKSIFIVIICSALLASVLVFYSINIWLQNFAYHIAIDPMIFIFATLIVLAVTCFTLFLQSIKVATERPVKALRYE